MDAPGNMPPRRGRLVIADDSAEMRWMVRSAIGDEFAEVIEVADGRELFWFLMSSAFRAPEGDAGPQVLVTDQYMPAYNGLDVLDAWRDLDPEAVTILITAFPNDEVRRRAAELGAVMLPKPFTTATLRRTIHEVDHGRHP